MNHSLPMQYSIYKIFAISIVSFLVIAPESGMALEKKAQFTSEISSVAYSNIYLSSTEEKRVCGQKARFSGAISLSNPTTSFSITPNFTLTNYPDRDLDRNDISLTSSLKKSFERSTYNLSHILIRDTSFSSESTTTGYVQDKVERRAETFSTNSVHSFSEVDSISISMSRNETKYDNGLSKSLYDYSYLARSLSYTRTMNSSTSLSATLSRVSQEVDLFQIETTVDSLELSVNQTLSDTLNYKIGIAADKKNTIPEIFNPEKKQGWLFNANLKKTYEKFSLKFGYSRDISPSGGGYLIQQDKISSTITYSISPQLGFSSALSLYRNEAISDSDISLSDSSYLNNAVSYKISKEWHFSFSHQYRHNKYENSASAHDNSIKFSLKFSDLSII